MLVSEVETDIEKQKIVEMKVVMMIMMMIEFFLILIFFIISLITS